MTAARKTARWWEHQAEVLTFARVLHSGGEFETVEDALYFIEKPWKWDAEHTRWIDLGAPLQIAESEELREAADSGCASTENDK